MGAIGRKDPILPENDVRGSSDMQRPTNPCTSFRPNITDIRKIARAAKEGELMESQRRTQSPD